MLTEVSCMPQLSQNLKEKFGGLKKFFERFSDVFVFSDDHPFNPHVLLRTLLTPDDQKMVQRGVLPTHVMNLYKKVNLPREWFYCMLMTTIIVCE
jgi:hypothetical protein